jgi:anti-sigma factor RsiW
VQCAESLRVQAYFDGEVDALAAAEIERHAGHCAECRALLQDLERTRARMRRDLDFPQAPAALRERIARALDDEEADLASRAVSPAGAAESARSMPLRERDAAPPPWRTRPFWQGAFGALGAAAAAALVYAFLFAAPSAGLEEELTGAHVRSLMPGHLTDVVSTDQHTVKPWFAGHADVSPVVADFSAAGYRLVGGRADYLERQRAAVLVYQHGAHFINVFAWADGRHAFPERTTRAGYHLMFWKVRDLEYCAVSDAGWDELAGLVRLMRDLGAADLKE